MNKFFSEIMLEGSAIYTLIGSKPMTKIDIHYYSEEEVRALYDELSEEEKKSCIVLDRPYDLSQNWEKWEQLKSRFPMKRFLFFKINDPMVSKFASIYLVDIEKVVHSLRENYDLFKQAIGSDFEPSKVVQEIEKGSEFWKKVFSNSTLMGLLYGYGIKNSCCFSSRYQSFIENNQEAFMKFESNPSDQIVLGDCCSILNFSIPIFTSFFKEDEIVEKYKHEREEIQRAYKDRNFLDFTLLKLAK